ncbi:MAG: hypothetical protein ABI543_02755 [Ignavibacteria bacterium]
MKLMFFNRVLPILTAFLMLFALYSCDGVFPSESKSNVPSDHTRNRGGAMHKGEEGSDECNECHGNDLRGQVYNYNGTLVVTSSCYQCHGNVWEGGGGGGDKKLFKNKR